MAVFLLGFAVYLYVDLTKFETEGGERRLWAPLAFLYNIAGKWGAVLFIALLGVAMVVIAIRERAKPKPPSK